MRKRFAPLAAPILAQMLVLGGAACATTQASAPAPAPVAAPGNPADPGAVLARAGRPDAPTLAALQHAFGPADLVRREAAGAILTYRLEECALVLVFAADSRNEMRLAEASAQPARADRPAASLSDCAAAAKARIGTS